MRILITGATGLMGSKLIRKLKSEGHEPIAVTRVAGKAKDLGVEIVEWKNPEKEIFPSSVLESIDVVVHLAGEGIAASRWTTEQKRKIRDSRILSTRNLVSSLDAAIQKPKAFTCASAIGFYGNRGNEILDELASPGPGFLADICREWEAEAERATAFGLRVSQIRIGIVLAPESGALKEMLPIFNFGLGGSLGDGQQWFSWIHVEDVVGIIHEAIMNESISGPINAVAPNAVTNEVFTKALAHALNRPSIFSVPDFMLRLVLGEMADLLLSSMHVIPKLAIESGYNFQYPELLPALQSIFRK